MQVYVFSYNRGIFLQNCLDSIRRQIPRAKIRVVDDHSDDPETVSILQGLPPEIPLLQPDTSARSWYGGLYANMQLALEDANETDRILLIQDDAQVVRPLDDADFAYIEDYFERFPDRAFLNPVFASMTRRSLRRASRLHPDFPVYFHHFSEFWRDRSVTMYYIDMFVGDIGRLRAVNWRILHNERATARQARTLFGRMGRMAHPFVAQLPEVPIFRQKRLTWALRRVQQLQGPEPRIFACMGPQELAAFRQRDLQRVPYAEDWLHCAGKEAKRPFQHKVIDAYPLLKVLHKLELKCMR